MLSKHVIQELIIDAPATKVTLLEDRAQVRRIAKFTLVSGLWRVKIEQVTPVLADKSLRAEYCQNYPQARIDDVRARRKMLVKETDKSAEVQALSAEIRTLLNNYNNANEDRQHLESSFRKINTILLQALKELPTDAIWGQIDPTSWREQLSTLFQQLRNLRTEILNNHHSQQILHDRIDNLITKASAIARPDMVYCAYIEADLTIPQTGEYEIAFDYVVPNAMWRPCHQARLLLESTPSISWRVDGCVWQRTGEDWNNVDLVFSTARASLGTEPPLLKDDILNVQAKSDTITIQARNQTVQTTGLGSTSQQRDTTLDIPGVDDGGEIRNLSSVTKATIPSDGRPYRVPIFSFDSPAEVEYILMPELAPQVVLKSTQINTAKFPILAGPVDLVRSTEYVGKASINFIAPGEKFALGWEPDAAIRVQRVTTEEKEQDHLTKWNNLTTTTKLFISNIGAERRVVKTTERVPISELEQVKVEVITEKTTDSKQPDENGFCNWDFILEPYSQISATLVYKISAASEVEGI